MSVIQKVKKLFDLQDSEAPSTTYLVCVINPPLLQLQSYAISKPLGLCDFEICDTIPRSSVLFSFWMHKKSNSINIDEQRFMEI